MRFITRLSVNYKVNKLSGLSSEDYQKLSFKLHATLNILTNPYVSHYI